MISVALARRLTESGIEWRPTPGDQFAVPDRDLDGVVFTVSDMVVEALDLPTDRLLCFNGTTEWALDSIKQSEVIWLPREDQLRTMIGDAFVSMEAAAPEGFVVTVRGNPGQETFGARVAEDAYALALLAVRGQ